MSGNLVIEAVRKSVTVDCAVEEAFRVFTADVASWWPTATHSIHGDDVREIVFEQREGGELYELSRDGDKGYWATVVSWEPPTRLVLAWEVNPSALGTEVEVRFFGAGARTRVELEHRGWERLSEPGERASYETGWDYVLGHYVDRV